MEKEESLQKATFAAGCFWCAEAALKLLEGVESVTSGYAGPEAKGAAPTYEQVSTGSTPYVEAVQVAYDPAKTSYADLLKIFWEIHNPTERNKQGPDIGPQYQAVIFAHTAEQQQEAEASRKAIAEEKGIEGQIATEIKPFEHFYPAEAYHKDYYAKNPEQSYSKAVIEPKIEKAKKAIEKLENKEG